MKKIYVGCSLAQAPDGFKQHILDLKEKLKGEFEVLEFLGEVKGSVQDVFRHDIECVKSCDIFLADVTYPSTGLGYELAVAVQGRKTIIAVAREGVKVSRLVQGIDYPKYSFHRYNKVDDIINLLRGNV